MRIIMTQHFWIRKKLTKNEKTQKLIYLFTFFETFNIVIEIKYFFGVKINLVINSLIDA